MDILFITATLPYPPTDGAKIRLFSLIKNLSARHKVSVVSFVTPQEHRDAIEHLRCYCRDVQVVSRNPHYPVSKILWGLIGPTPFPILNYSDPALAALTRRTIESNKFDIVQAEALQAAQYCTGVRHCTVIDLFDIHSVVMGRYAEQQHNPLKRVYAQITAKKLAHYEQLVCRRFTHCLTASLDDRDLIQRSTGLDRVSVIPNGVDLDLYADLDDQGGEGNQIVFIGRMDYAPNVHGIRWFCHEVLPLIRAQRPDTILTIVGKHPTADVKSLALPGLVEVTGFVEDVRPFLQAATVSIIPLKIGGGTRLKILEGLAMGKAIVSTSIGAEGLAITPERDILIADDAQGFASQVLRVLQDTELCLSLGRAGRHLVQSHYGWDKIGKSLEDVYERILQQPLIFGHRL